MQLFQLFKLWLKIELFAVFLWMRQIHTNGHWCWTTILSYFWMVACGIYLDTDSVKRFDRLLCSVKSQLDCKCCCLSVVWLDSVKAWCSPVCLLLMWSVMSSVEDIKVLWLVFVFLSDGCCKTRIDFKATFHPLPIRHQWPGYWWKQWEDALQDKRNAEDESPVDRKSVV